MVKHRGTSNDATSSGVTSTGAYGERETILRNVDIINALRGYALGLQAPPPRSELNYAEPAYDFLMSPLGKEVVRRWVSAFANTMGLIQEFRNELVHGSLRPREEDTQEVAKSSANVIEALSDSISRKASRS